MLQTLQQIDESLFYFINVKLANPLTNLIMPGLTNDMFLRALLVVAVVILLWKGNRRLRWAVLFAVLVLAVTDQLSSAVLKPWIGRLRPCHTLENITLLVTCGVGKSMPSSHAANVFGQAAFYATLYPQVKWYLYPFAALVAVSRVFVGVHYPGDIIVGSILGFVVGVAVALLMKRIKAVNKDS